MAPWTSFQTFLIWIWNGSLSFFPSGLTDISSKRPASFPNASRAFCKLVHSASLRKDMSAKYMGIWVPSASRTGRVGS